MRWVVLLAVGLLGAAISGRERPEHNGADVLRTPAEAFVAPAVVLETVTTGLPSITGVTSAGDSRVFLTTQTGPIRIWDGAQVLPTPFLDLSAKITCCGERGLLSTAFHPLYASNGFFFVNYTNLNGDTVVERYHVSSGDPNRGDPDSAAILLTIPQPYPNHNGGQLQFGPDGFLYIGMGDGGSGNDPECRTQSNQTLLGKLLRIDVDQNVGAPPFYGIPPENPFVSTGGPAEAWAKGLRNPWRFSFDRLTGDLFIGDVGQGDREEIDYQALSSGGGQNYGWKVMEGTLCGGGGTAGCAPIPPPCGDPAYTPPILEYAHDAGCSVTGGYVYRGLAVPDLYGMYVYGDYCSGTIWAAVRQGAVWSATPLSVTATVLTTFGEDARGDLYIGTETGRLLRFAPASPPVPSIASISPTFGLTRGGAVTITGANFTFDTQVFFGSAPAVVHVASPSTLTAVAPPGFPGTVDVTVSNPGAAPAVLPGAYTYLPIVRVTPYGTPRTVIRIPSP